MSLKTWFLGAATISRAAAARYTDIPLDDFREAADELGYGLRLTFPQIEEVIGSLGDDDEQDGDEDTEDDADEDTADDTDDEEAE